ncbi:hypothetical protein [Agarilytica rhodophyticola]|uniref:hypothetical protein n=1 Tax=Agarilytica rhodophyticola TaxID=1737490 RepID=UPI000B34463F|nr:hypothetical protein [Agarilytica rhodophyticola]
MYKFLLVFCCVLSFLACAQTSSTSTPYIPVSIDAVETHRIGDDLIRVIKHNMEISPKLELERMSLPGFKVLEQRSISSIQLPKERLIFENSEGVFVEDVQVKDNTIYMVFDYSFSGGGSALINCTLTVRKTFGKLICARGKYR